MGHRALRSFSTALATPPPMAPRSGLRRYGLAVVAVAATVVVMVSLPSPFVRSGLLVLLGAVVASAWYGGLGPGFLATALSVVAIAYYSVTSVYWPAVGAPTDALLVATFALVAVLTSVLADARMRAERNVREQWDFCRVTLTSIGDAVVVTDATGRVTFMNAVAQSLTGWTLAEAFGRSLQDVFNIVNEQTRDLVESPVSKVAREGVVVGLANHTVLIGRDGIERPIDDSGAPIRDRAGSIVGVVLVFRDVTERKQAEAARADLLVREQTARAQAEAANRAKDEFLATVSHELRTPLTAVLGWIRLVRAMTLDPRTQARGLEAIERNARAQAQLIDDLLDVSRIITGRLQLDVRPVDLVSVIDAAAETLRPARDAKAIRLELALDPTAGPVLGDAARLQQVVWNLLSNAIKFTPKDGRVHVRLERAESMVVITVRDTGQGIAPEFLPHVFDRFSQAEPRETRSRSGLGLGLAIVRHLVDLHGGTVQAESAGRGHGATFRVSLPMPAMRRPMAEVEGESRPSALPDLAGVRVLLLEDNEDAQELVRTLLERCGAAIRIVESSGAALQAIAEERPDVIVSDIGIPGEDGYAFIRRLRALPADEGGRIPAVALTAYALAEDRTRALEVGFQMHIAKPVEPTELATGVARLAGRGTSA